MTSITNNQTISDSYFNVDELPDGACISPKRIFPGNYKDGACTFKNVKYIGSVLIVGDDANSRAKFVQQQLTTEWDTSQAAIVNITVSLNGIQICFENTQKVCMNHPLSRVSFSSCDVNKCFFSFVACERSDLFRQYCHLFITSLPEHANELHEIVDGAFRMPFTFGERNRSSKQVSDAEMDQLSKQLTFHELIEQQVAQQQAENQENDAKRKQQLQQQFECISTTRVSERARERNDRRRMEEEKARLEKEKEVLEGKERSHWAKYVAPRVRHRSPHVEANGKRHSSPAIRSSESYMHVNRCSQIEPPWQSHHHHGSPVVALKEHIDNQFNNGSISSLAQRNASSSSNH